MTKKKMRIITSAYAEDSNGNPRWKTEPEVKDIPKWWRIGRAIVVILSLCGGAFVLFTSSKPALVAKTLSDYPTNTELPAGVDAAYLKKMAESGFSNTKDFKTFSYITERNRWKNNFGLNFIGDDEMTKFLADNFFIMGSSRQYIANVPPQAGNTMLNNLERVKDSLPFTDGGISISNNVMTRLPEFQDKTIYIIAGANKFNTEGMRIEDGYLKAITPPDPIAVIKVDRGYLELANW